VKRGSRAEISTAASSAQRAGVIAASASSSAVPGAITRAPTTPRGGRANRRA
jgi:hypothetical protein